MMFLLLFTYCTVWLHSSMGYHTSDNNYPTNDNYLLQQLFQEHQDDPVSIRSSRQNRIGNSRRNNEGFNWDSSRNNFNSITQRPSRQSDFIFDEDNEFNDVVRPNRPNIPNRPNRPNRPLRPNRPNKPNRPTTQRTPSSTVAIPGMATTRSACEDACQATTQFDPICGDNNVTYTNIYWLRCAQRCGRNINVKYRGACPRVG